MEKVKFKIIKNTESIIEVELEDRSSYSMTPEQFNSLFSLEGNGDYCIFKPDALEKQRKLEEFAKEAGRYYYRIFELEKKPSKLVSEEVELRDIKSKFSKIMDEMKKDYPEKEILKLIIASREI